MNKRSCFLRKLESRDKANRDYEPEEIQAQIKDENDNTVIDFKGLPVQHRFSTPIEVLEMEHNLENLKILFRELKDKALQNKGFAFKNDDELPNAETVLEGSKTVIDEFPYKMEAQDAYQNQPLDSMQLVAYETQYNLEQEHKSVQHWEMIRQDFPTLSEEDINNNIEAIEEYYAKNLNYEVFEEIANNEEDIATRVAANKVQFIGGESGKIDCFVSILDFLVGNFSGPIFYVKAAIALAIVGRSPERYAEDYYGERKGGGDTRGDAYKHMIWNALLANNYFTIISKWPRTRFARLATNAYEECTGEGADSVAMDFHNNAIGRDIWDDNTSYRRFLGIPFALRRPSTAKLKDLVESAVNRKSCFIVKFERDRFPNDLLEETQTDAQIKSKIEATPSNIAVYFNGTISPYIRTVWNEVATGYDYTPCYNGDYLNCPSITYEWVATEIPACYKL